MLGLIVTTLFSCKKYLDVVPDNIATIDNAFTLRSQAEKYLFTCYSFMPVLSDWTNPTFMASGEMTTPNPGISPADGIQNIITMAYGGQNRVAPIANYWDGEINGKALYVGIRDCNIFLENIGKVPDMLESEKNKWIPCTLR